MGAEGTTIFNGAPPVFRAVGPFCGWAWGACGGLWVGGASGRRMCGEGRERREEEKKEERVEEKKEKARGEKEGGGGKRVSEG